MPIKEQEITFRVPGVYLLYQLNGAIVNIKILCRVRTLKSPFVRKIILYVPFAVLDDPDEADGLSVSEKYGGDERDPVGDRAVYNLKIEKLGNRVLDLTPRMQALIINHYGIMTDEFKTYKETADLSFYGP